MRFVDPADPTDPSGRESTRSLADVAPGSSARIVGLRVLSTPQRERLASYGVMPGRVVRVVQHAPVTVLQIEHTELAIEHDIAREVIVEPA